MSSSNILFIGKRFLCDPSGGREMLSSLTFRIVKEIFQDQCYTFEIDSHSKVYPEPSLMNKIFKSHLDGISPLMINSINEIIDQNNINKVFIDGSNLGFFAKKIKAKFPKIHIFCSFHNVEAKFFFDSLIRKKSLKSAAILLANFLSERKAVLNSDHIIALTKNDSKNLDKIYGKFAHSIVPIALEDKFKSSFLLNANENVERYILFVGGNFFANEYGIKWFTKNVSPYIEYKTFIIGSGFENLKSELEQSKNVSVIGRVDSLSEWYINAEYVIAPIFEGSGMKTKVAEAMMYGKKILATSQALIGYEDAHIEAYYVCNTKRDYVELLSKLYSKIPKKFNENLRQLYLKEYSHEASKTRLERFL